MRSCPTLARLARKEDSTLLFRTARLASLKTCYFHTERFAPAYAPEPEVDNVIPNRSIEHSCNHDPFREEVEYHMIFTLTSNVQDVESIKYIQDDFVLCLTCSYINPMTTKRSKLYHFDIIHHSSVPVEDLYGSDGELLFDFHPVNTITDAIEKIAEILNTRYQKEQAKEDEDLQDEISLACCCSYPWTQRITRLISEELEDLEADVACQNLYRTLKQPSIDRIVQMLNSMLNTTTVTAEDPVVIGYALQRALGGMF